MPSGASHCGSIGPVCHASRPIISRSSPAFGFDPLRRRADPRPRARRSASACRHADIASADHELNVTRFRPFPGETGACSGSGYPAVWHRPCSSPLSEDPHNENADSQKVEQERAALRLCSTDTDRRHARLRQRHRHEHGAPAPRRARGAPAAGRVSRSSTISTACTGGRRPTATPSRPWSVSAGTARRAPRRSRPCVARCPSCRSRPDSETSSRARSTTRPPWKARSTCWHGAGSSIRTSACATVSCSCVSRATD